MTGRNHSNFNTRRYFLKTVGTGAAGFALSSCVSASQSVRGKAPWKKHPNILWLISEDTSPDIGCYGVDVKTPNIDKLASQGVRYVNAYVTAPVCSPSRSAFMTSMYQTTIGAHQHRSHRNDGYKLPEPVRLITDYFRRAGYFTCNSAGLNRKKGGKTDWNFTPKIKPFDGTDWSQRKPGQPFFAQINFHYTHRAFSRDKNNPVDPAKVKIPPYYPDHPLTRRDWADYLESVQLLDGQIGQVLKRLDDEGISDNTVVFYFGDHGRCHVRGKQWLYEGGIRIPLIIRYPGCLEAGVVCDDLVSAIDFGTTSLNLAGIRQPKHVQGRLFLGKGAGKRQYIYAARDRCDETDDRIRCVKDKRYKLIRNFHPEFPYTRFNAYKKRSYPVLTLMEVLNRQGKLTKAQARFMAPKRPREELYDLEKDPYEIHNLAGDPAYADILKRLRNALNRWIKTTSDMGAIPEDKKVAEYWDRVAAGRYRKWLKGNGLSTDISDEELLKWWEKKYSIKHQD